MEKKIQSIQNEIGKLTKDTKGYNYKYFDINQLLEKIQPLLKKHDLVITQPIIDGKVTTMITDLEKGKVIKSELELPTNIEPQKIGSAITYFRRYTLVSLLALEAEDDDGKSASEGLSEVAFGKLRNAYKEKGTMTPEMQEQYLKCNPTQKQRIADITKDLRNNKNENN